MDIFFSYLPKICPGTFPGYLLQYKKYSHANKILGLEEFDANNKMIGLGFMAVKTSDGEYFDNHKSKRGIELKDSTKMNYISLRKIIEGFVAMNPALKYTSAILVSSSLTWTVSELWNLKS